MGVPGFFLWLMKKYKNASFVNEISHYDTKFKWLCLDANCLLHPKCFEVLGENPDFKDLDKLEDKMISRSIEYIEKLVSLINPTEGLYIAIDGVAPVAKIKQQRLRRFKSINDRDRMNRLKDKFNIPKTKFWNNSSITPGTDFMDKITNRIIDWGKKQEYKVVFSSARTPSEGEHKILDFIRLREKNKESGPYVIYGLDADLIFLGLALERDDVFLMREASQLDKTKGEELTLVDLEVMKKSVIDTMLDNLDESIKHPKNNELINDFIFICYFLGNDFLPHNVSLDVYGKGLDTLLECYAKMIEITHKPILDVKRQKSVKFNQKSLFELLKLLKEKEKEILSELPTKKKYRAPLFGSEYEQALQRIETLRFKIDDPVKLGEDTYDEYSKRYYEHFFKDSSDENMVRIVYEYLKGLVWVSNYYFVGCPSWEYYYPYDHAPFLGDIERVVGLMDLSKIKFKLGKPLKPFEQLLLVLPPQSRNLVPKQLQRLFNESSELGHMYPESFKQDFLYKRKFWQGIPELPYLEINLVKKVYGKNEKKLLKKDKDKLKIGKDYVL